MRVVALWLQQTHTHGTRPEPVTQQTNTRRQLQACGATTSCGEAGHHQPTQAGRGRDIQRNATQYTGLQTPALHTFQPQNCHHLTHVTSPHSTPTHQTWAAHAHLLTVCTHHAARAKFGRSSGLHSPTYTHFSAAVRPSWHMMHPYSIAQPMIPAWQTHGLIDPRCSAHWLKAHICIMSCTTSARSGC